ncbi:hypothetical protein [Bacillus cereus]|uniref:hypothetical protein n=1 Tax=Bacillus cereus TaxID=1396 RepID=UPI000BFA27EA|nr:hypothetical protein [Bacillus cereus]PFN68721.1 hypothetical protein COJ59_14365 [Bacillus cereus]
MSKLKINRLKITIETGEGLFGTEISLQNGFNILRARNTKGKSSSLNAILYALGIEELLGGKGAKTMKPVLKDKLLYSGKEIPILESKVQLEISNNRNDIITLTRWIKSSSIDDKLIRVHFGPAIELNIKNSLETKDFYVHLQGAAVEKAGFHKFLEGFLGLELPLVPSFDGKDKRLYIQSLFPLFFVEQNEGWSRFYVPISGNYGIRDLSKRAFEFLLDMDVIRNSKEKEELKVQKALITSNWQGLKRDFEGLAFSMHAEIPRFPDKPTLLDELHLNIVGEDNKLITIEEEIFTLEDRIKEKESFGVKVISEVADEYEEKIGEQETVVMALQNEVNSFRQDLRLEINNQKIMVENLENLEIDLKRNKEASKLYKLGSDIDSTLPQGLCPTCHQHVEDTLMPKDTGIKPLDLDENIKFINEQIATLKFGIKQSKLVIKNKESRLAVILEHLNEARRELRLYKTELSENPKLPTKRELDKIVEMKIRLNKLSDANESFEKLLSRFENIKDKWKNYLKRLENMSSEYFSKLDNEKLAYFEKCFLILLKEFSFSSIKTNEISISHDKYTPIVKGFDIKFDSSASDNIRLIWSYIIAIFKTSEKFAGNHPGLMVFDEPGQQQMAMNSQKELFEVLAKSNGQSIVGTSLEPHEIKEIIKDLNVNFIDLGEEYIIKPFK